MDVKTIVISVYSQVAPGLRERSKATLICRSLLISVVLSLPLSRQFAQILNVNSLRYQPLCSLPITEAREAKGVELHGVRGKAI